MGTNPPPPAGEQPERPWLRAWRKLWRKRTVEDIVASNRLATVDTERTLNRHTLVLVGFAVLIGAGIFRLTAGSIATYGGVNTVVALAVAGVSFLATAGCYAEFASMVPVAGSAFTYAQAGIGRGAAWGIGCLLLIEYGTGAAAVSENLASELLGDSPAVPYAAAVIVGLLGTALWFGGLGRWAARLIVGATYLKLLLIAILVVGGLALLLRSPTAVNAAAVPASPPLTSGAVAAALAVVFFAYAGFDAVTTAADEAVYPRRHLPRAMLLALSLTVLIYVALAAVVWKVRGTGDDRSVATVFGALGEPFLALCAKAGSVIGQATVAYVLLYGLGRIMASMIMASTGQEPPSPRHRRAGNRPPGWLTPVATAWVLVTVLLSASGAVGQDGLTELVNTATDRKSVV